VRVGRADVSEVDHLPPDSSRAARCLVCSPADVLLGLLARVRLLISSLLPCLARALCSRRPVRVRVRVRARARTRARARSCARSCFKHFVYFVYEYSLIPNKQEMAPLQELIDQLMKRDESLYGKAATG
jgi:hypothetical protein